MRCGPKRQGVVDTQKWDGPGDHEMRNEFAFKPHVGWHISLILFHFIPEFRFLPHLDLFPSLHQAAPRSHAPRSCVGRGRPEACSRSRERLGHACDRAPPSGDPRHFCSWPRRRSWGAAMISLGHQGHQPVPSWRDRPSAMWKKNRGPYFFHSEVQKDVGLSENVGYIPNYSHLIGIMISKTIGYNGVHNIFRHTHVFSGLRMSKCFGALWEPGCEKLGTIWWVCMEFHHLDLPETHLGDSQRISG